VKKAKALHPVPKPKHKPKGPRHRAPSGGPLPGAPRGAGVPPAPGAGRQPAHHAKPGKPGRPSKPKKPKPKKPARKLSPGCLVACCSAEAVAMSLRLAGGSVTDDDVLALYFATADDPDDGASIADTLEVAGQFGLGLIRPTRFGFVDLAGKQALDNASLPFVQGPHFEDMDLGEVNDSFGQGLAHGLILGLDLPEGPHAVYATEAGWWSWGELYPASAFSDAVIGEAWAVTW
jgi:hypothetical protein